MRISSGFCLRDAADVPVTASSRLVTASPVGGDVTAADTLIPKLLALGSSPLDDLAFETGASALTNAQYLSLEALAGFLAEDPNRRVVLVGHTDAEGSLDANIRLSEARANAVRVRLLDAYSTNPAQVEARGIGYLAPRAVNTSPEGREANRRVEVVLIGN
jgi:OOP family OmpA-OmpF porin